MPAALLNAVLVVAFLTMYVVAGEVLVGTRRQRRRRRIHQSHPPAEPHWREGAQVLDVGREKLAAGRRLSATGG